MHLSRTINRCCRAMQRVIATKPTCLTQKREILWHFEQKAVLLAIPFPFGEREKFWINIHTYIHKNTVMQGMYVGVKVRDIRILILYVRGLFIPCLGVYALKIYSYRNSGLTTVLINLKIYIPL